MLIKLVWVLIFVAAALAAARLLAFAAFFAEPGAFGYVLYFYGILAAYAAVSLWIAVRNPPLYKPVIGIVFAFGALSGLAEILTVAVENGIVFPVQNQYFSIVAMFGVFSSWAVCGFWAARRLRTVKAGIVASVLAAALCMLIGVTGGLLIELFLAPAPAQIVAAWAEFKRSGWDDAAAFQVANSLESAFEHLLLAPVVAAVFGTIGATAATLARPRPAP